MCSFCPIAFILSLQTNKAKLKIRASIVFFNKNINLITVRYRIKRNNNEVKKCLFSDFASNYSAFIFRTILVLSSASSAKMISTADITAN